MSEVNVLTFNSALFNHEKKVSNITSKYYPYPLQKKIIVDGLMIVKLHQLLDQIITITMKYNGASIPLQFRIHKQIGFSYIYKLVGNYKFDTDVINPTEISVLYTPTIGITQLYDLILDISI